MPPDEKEFLDLRNHQEVRRILERFAQGASLQWFDEASNQVTRRWFRLAQQHLRAARQSSLNPKDWRATTSRSYYAVYNASKSLRYLVFGEISQQADDHKRIGNLPKDFPDKDTWASRLVDLRRDRNIADYEPWHNIKRKMQFSPETAVDYAYQFVRTVKEYLRNRGVSL